jgi:hypothetical protein
MRFQRKLFDFEPWEKVSVLLLDFSDSGNASAGAVPRDGVTIQLAPLSYAFETMTSNERINTYMNHELVHVATMDRPGPSDRFFRRAFAGKVNPVAEQPETILYLYLTAPRVAVPRWYLEGSAVFVETWMAGGIGRAQGAYDEMVFRAMVRDGSRFYDPLGLVSEGTKVDFQTQANAYLYGTRFITWLALERSPEKVVEWLSRKDGSRAYFASQFKHVFGTPPRRPAEWIAFEHNFQQANLDAIGSTRRRLPRHLEEALGSSRGPGSTRRRGSMPPSTTPSSPTWARSPSTTVPSSAWSPSRGRSCTPWPPSPGIPPAGRSSTRRTTTPSATWSPSTRSRGRGACS